MYIRRNIKWSIILRFAWRNLLLFTIWSSLVTVGFLYLKARGINIGIPFLPISTIGIAVAFYVGFKNSQSYDRFWEGRKIWGAIVNYSRTWANQVQSYVTDKHALKPTLNEELMKMHKELIYRHIAWINVLRLQLRSTTIFDRKNITYVPNFKLKNDTDYAKEIGQFLDSKELEDLVSKTNSATHLLRKQGDVLREITQKKGWLDDFRHMDMMHSIEQFYNFQGQCERIKNTPFPRQYAYFSAVFVWIFIILLPFGLVQAIDSMSNSPILWINIPISVLISWVFYTIEVIGDNSEDPFENYINDVPMTAICRTIEIDLRELLGETDIPKKIEPVNGILL